SGLHGRLSVCDIWVGRRRSLSRRITRVERSSLREAGHRVRQRRRPWRGRGGAVTTAGRVSRSLLAPLGPEWWSPGSRGAPSTLSGAGAFRPQIGRASCRERVLILVGGHGVSTKCKS